MVSCFDRPWGEAGHQNRSPAPGCGRTHPLAKPTEHLHMNELNGQSPSSRKIITAIAMAVVVGIGTATFALRSHRPTVVAQIPAVPAAVAQTPDATSSVAQTPD